jgi:antitoxin component YwqK of YwqJK toxin-antitoxin module
MRVDIADTEVDEAERVLYQGVPLTGEVDDAMPDGTVVTLKSYVDGREEGWQREWYEDGTRESEYRIVDGRLTGESLKWYPNGQLKRRQEFDQFGVLRKREAWDENGVLQSDQSVDTWPVGDHPIR